ncbi:hypothetical protein roselon_01329 [Roseibacterium elongatum DSM 19469]|uniref:Uncharacterized protein n=1 Tax=Roseicyclus elongatus DSM 19469 TaxID=1294273 RepID=W8S0N6_9RHOB|nr:hypothetical protein roselon_01329 [Roseibacterium elongatum DSM 19469]
MLAGSVKPAEAQMLPVRSGEHDGFTRLVVTLGPDRSWALEGAARRWQLTVDPAPDGFETGTVFDLIRRDRLAELSADGALTLTLACDCTLDAYRFRDRYLVIDIADPAEDAANPRAAEDAQRRATAAAALPDLARLLTRGLDTAAPAVPAARALTPAAAAEIDLGEAAAIMAEQLARAAASGLLEATPGRPMRDADPAIATPADPDTPGAARPDPQPPLPPTAPGSGTPALGPEAGAESGQRQAPPIRAETAFDAAHHADAAAEPRRPPLACAGRSLGVADWADGAGVDRGLGALRRSLFDDRDQLVRDGAIALARHYLYYGFGAEAAFWLHQVDADPSPLLVIAALSGRTGRPRFPAPTETVACSPDELFWRYVTGSDTQPLSDEQMGQIQRYHAGLPHILRDHLGPDLARRLQADGHIAAARNVADALARGGRQRPVAVALLDLDLGIAPPSEGLRPILDRALEQDGANPAETMAHALALNRGNGRPPEDRTLTAAEALLRETPPGPTRARLWHEVVMAHAAAGDMDRAIAMVSDAEVQSPDIRQPVITSLLENRLEHGDTAALSVLAHFFGRDWAATGSEAGRIRVAVIDHLQAAGLWRAAAAMRDRDRIVILPARPDRDAGPEPSLPAAWARRDWAVLADQAEGAGQGLAQRMLRARQDIGAPSPAQTPAAATAPDLSKLSQLVEDSRALRATITSLFAGPMP